MIILDHLTEAQKRAYILADNQLALNAGWAESLLSIELAALHEGAFDLGVIGFEDEELARLLAAQDAAEGLTDEDAVPEVAETAVSVAGDLWVLGQHRLLCGDATTEDSIRQVLAGSLADLAFCDPPYAVSYIGKTAKKLTIKNDDLGADFYDFLQTACTNILAVTKGAVYICMSSSELHTLFRAFTDAGCGHLPSGCKSIEREIGRAAVLVGLLPVVPAPFNQRIQSASAREDILELPCAVLVARAARGPPIR